MMENKPVLEVENLSVSFAAAHGELEAVRGVSFSLNRGEVLAIIGESGCGKSVLCKSILKLLPASARITSGSIRACGTDITGWQEREMKKLRGSFFSMVFQNPMTSLNPSVPVGAQIAEAVKLHRPGLSRMQLQERTAELMRAVRIENPDVRMKMLPESFSGGMRQRIVLAIALAASPAVLFADEPTTSLDVAVQAQMLKLLREIRQKSGMGIVFVTHDLAAAAQLADRAVVMRAGAFAETGTIEEIYHHPKHPYTKELLRALPAAASVPAEGTGTSAAAKKVPACKTAAGTVLHAKRRDAAEILLDVRHLSHAFPMPGKAWVKAVDDVSFQIRKGEIFGLAGESGSGKSTIARCIMNLYQPQEGSIVYQGIDVCDAKLFRKNRRMLQAERQMIFQDSDSSLNPRMKVWEIAAEPMKIQHIRPRTGSYRSDAVFWLQQAGLDASYADLYPPVLSGGQRQRAAIARALSMQPQLLVADEPAASLDVLMRAQIMRLFLQLHKEHGFSVLFISHDLAMIAALCDRAGVMYRGKMVECAPVTELFAAPKHPYTKSLLGRV